MKAIYRICMAAVFSGFALAGCDKELKENTQLNVSVATAQDVSFDGKTVTVKKGTPVTFNLEGDPDFISFFSGEIGSEYKFRNRTEMKLEDVVNCQVSFEFQARYDSPVNTPQNAIDILISEDFPGMAKNNFTADKELVASTEWSHLVPTAELPARVIKNDEIFPYTKDLKSYMGKKIAIAFHYKGGTDGVTGRQPGISILKLRIDIAFNNNKSEAILAKDLGFTPLNIVNNETDQQNSKVKDKEYGTVDGSVPGFWNTAQPTSISIGNSAIKTTLKNSWLISSPLLLNPACSPDKGMAIKNISQALPLYSHTYEEAGTYTATFVANNANFVHEGGQVVRELTIKVIE